MTDSDEARGPASGDPGETDKSWILDPNVFVFAGDSELPVGAVEQHGLSETFGNLFGKSKEAVKANWDQIIDQTKYLLARLDTAAGEYELSEISFELGFSAEGIIVFVAQAGVSTTINVTFRRKTGIPLVIKGGGPTAPRYQHEDRSAERSAGGALGVTAEPASNQVSNHPD